MKVGHKILSVSADGFEELRRLGLLRYNAGRDIEIYDYYLSEVDITGSRNYYKSQISDSRFIFLFHSANVQINLVTTKFFNTKNKSKNE